MPWYNYRKLMLEMIIIRVQDGWNEFLTPLVTQIE